ncbi:MAG: bifunctional demethylmenaquinone methyltransferase/2-methoxy-6-polyprenyl-1,4-benzoquinol methylase UbiE [Bacteroidales bacterium]
MGKKEVESIKPYNEMEGKGSQIKRMFDAIASKYDVMNRLISLGCDKRWRSSAIKELKRYPHENILDIATGTGDMAVMLYDMLDPVSVTGCDISEGMLKVAREKADEIGLSDKILFEVGDCTVLPFGDDVFDVATIAFGIRNFEDLSKGLSEIQRVLKPGGVLSIIELSVPKNRLCGLFYNIYTGVIIPALGRILAKDTSAYLYLGHSVKAVPQGVAMTVLMKDAGFENCKFRYMTFGVCAVYTGVIPF